MNWSALSIEPRRRDLSGEICLTNTSGPASTHQPPRTSRRSPQPLELPQPARHPVPTGENLAHQLFASLKLVSPGRSAASWLRVLRTSPLAVDSPRGSPESRFAQVGFAMEVVGPTAQAADLAVLVLHSHSAHGDKALTPERVAERSEISDCLLERPGKSAVWSIRPNGNRYKESSPRRPPRGEGAWDEGRQELASAC